MEMVDILDFLYFEVINYKIMFEGLSINMIWVNENGYKGYKIIKSL